MAAIGSDWSAPSSWSATGGGSTGGMWGTGGGMAPGGYPGSYPGGYPMLTTQAGGMTASLPRPPTPIPTKPPVTPQATSLEDVWNKISKGGGLLSGNQTVTQTFNPWAPQGKGLEGVYKEAETEYDRQRALGAPQFSQESNQALNRMEQLATGANPLVGKALNAVQDVSSGDTRIGTGGMFGDMYQRGMGPGNASQYNQLYNDPGIDQAGYKQMAGQNAITNQGDYERLAANNIGAGQFHHLYGQNQGQGSLGGGMFGGMAEGGLVGANPYRESNIKQSMGDTAKMVKASMSKAGRYGSDAYGDAMGKALSSVATQAREAGYNQDTANMMAAAQARSGETLARGGLAQQAAQGALSTEQFNRQQQLAAAQGISGLQGQNAQQRLAALQGLTGAQTAIGQQKLGAAQGLTGLQGQQQQAALAAAQGLTGVQNQNIQNQMAAAGMTPELQKLRYDDMNRLLGIGATKEAMTEQQRNFGWDQIGRLQGTYGSLPGVAGSQTEPGKPWWQTALGVGATALGGMGGMFG